MSHIIRALVRFRQINLDFVRGSNLTLNKRNAGHSKWANIKHIKAAKDHQKSTVFNKMSRLIRLAMQEGGSADPKFNVQLENVIAQARRFNMPVASIQNIIKQNKDTKINAKSLRYEIRGPGGCTIIVSALTENPQRLKSSLNTIVRKCNSTFTEGTIGGLFDHKGVIEANPPEKTKLETAVEHAIEVGAEDVTELNPEENIFQFICDPILLYQVKGKLQKLCYNIIQADCEFIPNRQVSLSDAHIELVQKLCNKLEEDTEVMKLHDNIA